VETNYKQIGTMDKLNAFISLTRNIQFARAIQTQSLYAARLHERFVSWEIIVRVDSNVCRLGRRKLIPAHHLSLSKFQLEPIQKFRVNRGVDNLCCYPMTSVRGWLHNDYYGDLSCHANCYGNADYCSKLSYRSQATLSSGKRSERRSCRRTSPAVATSKATHISGGNFSTSLSQSHT
jgi:hypothetical protein